MQLWNPVAKPALHKASKPFWGCSLVFNVHLDPLFFFFKFKVAVNATMYFEKFAKHNWQLMRFEWHGTFWLDLDSLSTDYPNSFATYWVSRSVKEVSNWPYGAFLLGLSSLIRDHNLLKCDEFYLQKKNPQKLGKLFFFLKVNLQQKNSFMWPGCK
jgi:hypothetical protein